MFSGIDLYSDTMTRPTLQMKQAMMDALVGDEQQNEDPTTLLLEEKMARVLGKTAAMFFPSATMCNQIAVTLHARAGDEVIGAEASHIFTSEGGGAAFHARAQARTIPCEDGTFDSDAVKRYVRLATSPHSPKSALLIIENTMNGGGGSVWPLSKQEDVLACARDLGLKTHLDGARIFNAAVASKTNIFELAHNFDSVTVCFSKGLGCPTGAILAFDKPLWPKVRRLKQVFGGAMRQSGILAAACLYALESHVAQIPIDHENAQKLAGLLRNINGLTLETPVPQSNMVYFLVDDRHMESSQFLEACLGHGVRFSRMGVNRFRAVTHRDVTALDVEKAAEIVRTILQNEGRDLPSLF